MALRLDFLGTDSVTPVAGEDTACVLINGRVLVDTGWHSPAALARLGRTPADLDWLLLTHLHHDHYLALPQLLFHRWMKPEQVSAPLRIAGPAEDLDTVVGLALAFLQTDRFGANIAPELHPLRPGDVLEAVGLSVSTARTRHPVASLAYRFDDPESGAALAYTGDTAYAPELAGWLRGVNLLVHEASLGERAGDASNARWGHSGSPDAARLAVEAGVDRLLLTHAAPALRPAALAAARAIFPATEWPPSDEPLYVNC